MEEVEIEEVEETRPKEIKGIALADKILGGLGP